LESDLGIEDYHLRSIEKVRIANFIIEKLTTVIDPLSKLANDRVIYNLYYKNRITFVTLKIG
jgi:hypothetical protein